MDKVGFIGVGRMGGAMVLNLLEKGYTVKIYDVKKEAMDKLIQKGAQPSLNPKEVAQTCRIVCSSLPTPDTVKAAYLGVEGVFAGCKSGNIAIDFSTTTPSSVIKVSQEAKNKGVDFLEAPVSGGVSKARSGTLTILVGGDKEVLDRVRPILELIGSNIHYAGKTGAANTVKLINQLLVGVNALAAIEAVCLAKKANVNLQLLYDVIKQSAGNSYIWEKKLPAFIFPRSFESGFSMKLMCKDLRLATDLARERGSFNLLSSIAEKMYSAGVNSGLGEKDYSSIISLMEKMSGIQQEN